MPENNIERLLTKITQDVLAYPHYNGKFAYSSVSAQRAAVKERLNALTEANCEIKLPILDHYNVIPGEGKEFSVYNDFGQSASDCLNVSQAEISETDSVLDSFLAAVKTQALEIGAKIAKDERDAASVSEQNARFQEYIIDLNKRQEKLDKQAQNVQQSLNNLEITAKQVAASVNTAITEANKITEKVNRAQKAAVNAKSKAREAKTTAKEVKTTAENMIPNMLSVLGIFVGVVIAVVACYLTILLEDKNAEAIAVESIPLAFMFAWLMGHILVMAIFMLFFMIAKLTDRTIICSCHHYIGQKTNMTQDCNQCPNADNCRPLKRLKSRFPYVYWINTIFFVGYIIIGITHIIDQYYAKHINPWIDKHPVEFLIICVCSIGLMSFIVWICKKFSHRARKINMSPTVKHHGVSGRDNSNSK